MQQLLMVSFLASVSDPPFVSSAPFLTTETGTGKTHTMLGADLWDLASARPGDLQEEAFERPENWGVIPRAVRDIFDFCEKEERAGTVSTLVFLSFRCSGSRALVRSHQNCLLHVDLPGHCELPRNL